MIARQNGHLDIVTLLVEAGAHVDVVDNDGISPLIGAIKGNFTDVAIYLLEHGANPNEIFVDDNGNEHNLLLDAVVESQIQFALKLLENGADFSATDSDGVSIITHASFQGIQEVVSFILESPLPLDLNKANNGDGINALIASSSEGHVDIVSMLLATGRVDENTSDNDGTTALMAASVRGHKDIVQLLVDVGVDVNAQNVDGHTALMFAYNGKNQVLVLKDRYGGYDFDDNNEEKKETTLLIQDALSAHLAVISILKDSGADLSLQDNEGHLAADFDYKTNEEIDESAEAASESKSEL